MKRPIFATMTHLREVIISREETSSKSFCRDTVIHPDSLVTAMHAFPTLFIPSF